MFYSIFGSEKVKRFVSLFMVSIILLQCLIIPFNASSVTPLDIISAQADACSEYGYVDFNFRDKSGNEVVASDYSYLPVSMKTRSVALPSAYDARNTNCITPVKEQGDSGNCWAFSAMSMLESNALVKEIVTENPDYSEAHFSWFTSKSMTSDSNDLTYGDGRNVESPYVAGGNWIISAGSLARWTGPANEIDYPFYPRELSSMGNYAESSRYDTGGGVVIRSAEELRDMNDVKQWIINNGSATLGFYYDNAYYNTSTSSYYYNGEGSLNHQVVIVGWDDSYSVSNFVQSTQPSGNGAWLCKNSWNTYWGDDGYFWISYYDTLLSQFAGFTVQSADEFYRNYTYNGAGWATYFTHQGSAKLSNVFEAKEYETVKAVSTYTIGTDSELIIKIYKNLPSGFKNPEQGTLASTVTAILPRAGYHTVDLIAPVDVDAGTKFAVVIEFVSDGTLNIPVEVDGQGFYSYESKAGQSYAYLPAYNSGWYDNDAYGLNNNFIQAFTVCNHQYTRNAVDATCSSDGHEKILCSQCGIVQSESVLPMLTHKFSDWSGYIHDNATGREVNSRVCEYCGLTESISYISGGRVITIDALIQMVFERIIANLRLLFR